MASSPLNDTTKNFLAEYYQSLDPVGLLNSMEMLQDKLWKYDFVALPGNAPITLQSLMPKIDDSVVDSQSEENDKQQLTPEAVPSDDRFYRSSKNTKRPKPPRTWRTRKDVFEYV